MVRRLVVILFTLIAPVVARSQEPDRYGGWKDVPLSASGAFRIEELGGRDLPDQVLSAAVEHVDAIAIQPGDGYLPIYTPGDRYPSQEITELREASGKPIMICDHQISFATERYPKSIWPYHQLASEAEAAEATNRFIIEAFSRTYVIGYMRCQYIDRFSSRRGASKLGLLRDDGTPYPLLVEATRRASKAVRESIHAELVGSNQGFSKSH